jgi:hypothetical protein
VRITSSLPALSDDDVVRAIEGLPEAEGYELLVRPLRYRTQPHLAAFTVFDDRSITLQVPEPFHVFGEVVHYGAKRIAGKGMKFVPLSEGLTFRARSEVVRFLYCHEWYHWFLYEVLGQKSSAEIACDRFALRNFRRREVTIADAHAALRRR